MNILPLVTRELREALRRPSTFRLRLICGAGSLGLTVWLLMAWNGPSSQSGELLFKFLSALGFLGSVGAGVFLAADCVSREKREGTLGFLFLTDLEAYDVLLGKFASCALVPAMTLLAIFPALAVAYLVGGVNLGEFWRMLLVELNTLFFALAVTIFSSTLCFRQRSAYLVATLLLLFFMVIAPMFGDWAPRRAGFNFSLGGPFQTFVGAFDGPYHASPWQFWVSLVLTQGVGWISLGLTAANLAHSWRRLEEFELPKEAGAPLWLRLIRKRNGNSLSRSEPLEWLANRYHLAPGLVWLLPALAVLTLAWVLKATGSQDFPFIAYLGICLLFRVEMGLAATGFFMSQKGSGSFELLLGTSITVAEITSGHLRSFKSQFRRPMLVLIGAGFGFAALYASSGRPELGFLFLVNSAMLGLDFFSLFWVGNWQGLKNQLLPWAILNTFLQILVLPAIWFGVLYGMFAGGRMTDYLVFWSAAYGVNSFLFLALAKDKVLRYFRELALRQFGEKLPEIESGWSAINWEEETNEWRTAQTEEFGASGPAGAGAKAF